MVGRLVRLRGEIHMKRLFALRDASGTILSYNGEDYAYFASKAEAKAARDELNVNRPAGTQACVTLGPDHFRYNSEA